MEPQLRELMHVGIVLGATVLIVGVLVLVGFLTWRAHQNRRHGLISKRRRYQATQIDLFRKREAGESSSRQRHHRRRHRHREDEGHRIDLFQSRSQGAAAEEAESDAAPPEQPEEDEPRG